MTTEQITTMLGKIAGELDACTIDVPQEISARSNLYFRLQEAAKEARMLIKEMQ